MASACGRSQSRMPAVRHPSLCTTLSQHCADDSRSRFTPAYFDAVGNPLAPDSAPAELGAKEFPTKSSLSTPSPLRPLGAAQLLRSNPRSCRLDSLLRSPELALVGGFSLVPLYSIDQPALQERAQLSPAQRAFVQSRVETLHRRTGRVSRWLKPRVASSVGLAAIERALILTPPAGLEAGYVPIALFEGLDQPAAGCTVLDAPPWSPEPPSTAHSSGDPTPAPSAGACPAPSEVPRVCPVSGTTQRCWCRYTVSPACTVPMDAKQSRVP
eukprot:1413491-Prymnesium_polylepis.1